MVGRWGCNWLGEWHAQAGRRACKEEQNGDQGEMHHTPALAAALGPRQRRWRRLDACARAAPARQQWRRLTAPHFLPSARQQSALRRGP